MRLRNGAMVLTLAGCLAAAGVVSAGDLGGDIKKVVKQRAGKSWYLKTNVPYFQGRHAYGTFKKPLVMVSAADGVKIEQSAEIQGGVFHAEGRRLVLRVNDQVNIDDNSWDNDEKSYEIELEGTGRTGEGQGVLKFVNLTSMDDFEKCWTATFSDLSIEQKYDWPDAIKTAVVARKVEVGMTPEQVLVAVGDPEKVSRSTDGGKKVEVWTIQRGEGAKMGFWTVKAGDKQEMEIRFIDGKVAQVGGADESAGVKLK